MNLIIAKRALGLFSIGLGVVAVAAPDRLARWVGLDAEAEAMSAFGAREIASGAGLLSPVKPAPWFWMRVGGDVMDLFALRSALRPDNPRRQVAIGFTAVIVAIAAIDVAMALHASTNRRDNAEASA
ncbi:MAG: hypothetical protein Q8M88_03440 [Phenylobacterium sp.]|uniref:hypothetical protein n=1 Tax=Phenylobacterium sp. TaxID=1871053 RepID=UPI002732D96D|nr:hypothetical protein [Phenylobacterium sp.]MDP3173470.1 hypothetical protein [Phenylobacterium sp.]